MGLFQLQTFALNGHFIIWHRERMVFESCLVLFFELNRMLFYDISLLSTNTFAKLKFNSF